MDGYFGVLIDYLVSVIKKKSTSPIFEEVLKEFLSEFDGVISLDFIDENMKVLRNLV